MRDIAVGFSIIITLLAGLLVAPDARAAAGDLDLSFGGTGKVTTAIGSGNDYGHSVAVQSDGKIVVAGSSSNGGGDKFAIARFNTDGTLDTSFNGTGKVTTALAGQAKAYSIALQNDRRIVVAGWHRTFTTELALVRYNTDGSLDTTFNGNGIVTANLAGATEEEKGLAIQSDGKIIVAGAFGIHGEEDFAVLRYNADGQLDETFNGTGKVTTGIGPGMDFAFSVALQSDGKIVAAGRSFNGKMINNNPDWDFAVVRYNANGSLDTTFNGTGKVLTAISSMGDRYDMARSVAVQADGKIVVTGYSAGSGFAVVRYDTKGNLDPSFGNSGKVTTAFGGSSQSVAIQSDGKLVVAGQTGSGFALVRYNTDGSLDTRFNRTGIVTTPSGALPPGNAEGRSVAVQADGKIVLAGWAWNGTNDDFVVLRYHGIVPADIGVEQPPGNPLADAGANPVDFGPVVAGSSSSKIFTIRNSGATDLTGLTLSFAAEGTPADFTIGALGATTLAPDAFTTFTVTFSPGGQGVRTATLLIASNDEDENPFEVNLAGSQATPLDIWRQTHFGSFDNSGPGADLSDPDGDGIVNLLEYATATDPQKSTLFSGMLVKNGNSLEFTYTRRNAALSEMTFVREFSETLTGTWSTVAGVTTILSDDGVLQLVEDSHARWRQRQAVRAAAGDANVD